MSEPADRLEALERRGDALEAFAAAGMEADRYIREHGTQALVDELRNAVSERRRIS